MLKKFFIMFFSVTLAFSATFISNPMLENVEASTIKYKTPIVGETKVVKTNPNDFPTDMALAFFVLGGAYNVYQVPKVVNQFLAWAGVSAALVSEPSTSYSVTMIKVFLVEPTSTSAGYYHYRIVNNSTGHIEYTKKFNIGKNGI